MPAKTPDKNIIVLLNDVLTGELTAVNQYFLHARMCQNWGYKKLGDYIRKESISEMMHAQELIDRVLFLGGVPNVQRLGKVTIGETVKEMMHCDLAVENEAIPRLNAGIEQCRVAGDNGTRLLLEKILASEEEHVDWIEAQLELIQQIGEPNYLAQQLG
ncbi:MAG: bacterioferritin [Deltaproteobacteria bacterium]|nr:bacterioferritin [Deltaproteobacteria bacterium]